MQDVSHIQHASRTVRMAKVQVVVVECGFCKEQAATLYRRPHDTNVSICLPSAARALANEAKACTARTVRHDTWTKAACSTW